MEMIQIQFKITKKIMSISDNVVLYGSSPTPHLFQVRRRSCTILVIAPPRIRVVEVAVARESVDVVLVLTPEVQVHAVDGAADLATPRHGGRAVDRYC